MLRNLEHIKPVEDEAEFLRSHENIVFETGQGLLLDAENKTYAPHVTGSRTGLHNIVMLLKAAGLKLNEACYVTRTYVTRHGAGPLHCETDRNNIGRIGIDLTNVRNDWQGSIRYAKHESIEEFLAPIREDIEEAEKIYPDFSAEKEVASLFITHLNETDSKIVFEDKEIPAEVFMTLPGVKEVVSGYHLSNKEENRE